MPVYEYKCEDCGRKFDVVATLSEKEAGLSPICPRCGGMRVRQVFGRFTVLSGSKSESDDFDAGSEGGPDDYDDSTESLDEMEDSEDIGGDDDDETF